jgi:hypothetical protein
MGNVDAAQPPRPVRQVDLEAALRVATTHIEGAEGRWKKRAKMGRTNAELAEALKEELVQFQLSCWASGGKFSQPK